VRIQTEDTVGVLDLRPLNAALLNSQLLPERKAFKDQVSLVLEYESEQSKDDLGKEFQR